MIPQDSRAPNSQQRWLEIYNIGAQIIPAYGVVEITDASMPDGSAGPTRHHAKRPTKDGLQNFYVNSFMPVPITGGALRGFATNDFPCVVAYDTSGDAPAPGETWGPKKDSFLIAKGQPGLLIIGHVDAANGWVRVIRIGVGDKIVRFQLTADLNTGGSAAAKVRRWNQSLDAGAGNYEDDPDADPITIYDWWSPSDGGVNEAARGMWQAKSGMEGWARQRGGGAEATDYDIEWMETFGWSHEGEATGNIDTGVTPWTLAVSTERAYEQGQQPDTSLTLRDYQELYPHALTGARTLAKRSEHDSEDDGLGGTTPLNPSYHLWVAQQMGFAVTATLSVPMPGNGDYAITDVKVMSFSPHNLPPSLTTCKNVRNHRGEANDEVVLVYHHVKDSNGATRQWFEVIDVTKKEVTYHQVRWNATTKCFQYREHTVVVEYHEPITSDWTDLICANPCPPAA